MPKTTAAVRVLNRLLLLGLISYFSMGVGCRTSTSDPKPAPSFWTTTVAVSDPANFTDAGTDARGIHPGLFGAEYGRMLKLVDGSWLSVYTIYDNNGYLADPQGGTRLQVARSTDNCRTWTILTTISDFGRDLDNGQMIQLANGQILLASRSVRWQESYRLPVYRSSDNGLTWTFVSMIDANEGTPGSLGNPDKGVYEPHFYMLANNELAVMYSSEKHVVENPSFSQIISEKTSSDHGVTWGKEIWVAAQLGQARPGMPVWTKLNNGQYMVVFEVCGTQNCMVSYKFSADGQQWPSGLGAQIPNERGGPYLVALSSGRLVLSSNFGQVSYSDDNGLTWKVIVPPPFSGVPDADVWSSVYETGANELAVMSSVHRTAGHKVQLRFGVLSNLP